MNIVVKVVAMSLKRWFAGPKRIAVPFARTARARIPNGKCLRLLPLEVQPRAVQPREPAAVARVAILAERVKRDNRPCAGLNHQEPMKIQKQEAKEMLIQRLRRVEGQIRGVETMLDEERDCQDILQQLSAIHSAVQSASRIFLQEYATACLLELDQESTAENRAEQRSKREKIVFDMITLLDKAP